MADPNEIVFEASTDEGGDAGGQDDICLGNVQHAVGQQQQASAAAAAAPAQPAPRIEEEQQRIDQHQHQQQQQQQQAQQQQAPRPPPPLVPRPFAPAPEAPPRHPSADRILVLFDLNGVLTDKTPRGPGAPRAGAREHAIRPGAERALLRLRAAGFDVGVYSSATLRSVLRCLGSLRNRMRAATAREALAFAGGGGGGVGGLAVVATAVAAAAADGGGGGSGGSGSIAAYNATSTMTAAPAPAAAAAAAAPFLEPVLHRAHCRPDPHFASRPGGNAWDTVKPLAAHGLDPRRVVLVDNDLRKAVAGEERNMVLVPEWGGEGDAVGESDLGLLAELLERHLLRGGGGGGYGGGGGGATAGGGGAPSRIGDVRLATPAIVEELLSARVAAHGPRGQPANMPLAPALRGLPDPPAHLGYVPPGGGGGGGEERAGGEDDGGGGGGAERGGGGGGGDLGGAPSARSLARHRPPAGTDSDVDLVLSCWLDEEEQGEERAGAAAAGRGGSPRASAAATAADGGAALAPAPPPLHVYRYGSHARMDAVVEGVLAAAVWACCALPPGLAAAPAPSAAPTNAAAARVVLPAWRASASARRLRAAVARRYGAVSDGGLEAGPRRRRVLRRVLELGGAESLLEGLVRKGLADRVAGARFRPRGNTSPPPAGDGQAPQPPSSSSPSSAQAALLDEAVPADAAAEALVLEALREAPQQAAAGAGASPEDVAELLAHLSPRVRAQLPGGGGGGGGGSDPASLDALAVALRRAAFYGGAYASVDAVLRPGTHVGAAASLPSSASAAVAVVVVVASAAAAAAAAPADDDDDDGEAALSRLVAAALSEETFFCDRRPDPARLSEAFQRLADVATRGAAALPQPKIRAPKQGRGGGGGAEGGGGGEANAAFDGGGGNGHGDDAPAAAPPAADEAPEGAGPPNDASDQHRQQQQQQQDEKAAEEAEEAREQPPPPPPTQQQQQQKQQQRQQQQRQEQQRQQQQPPSHFLRPQASLPLAPRVAQDLLGAAAAGSGPLLIPTTPLHRDVAAFARACAPSAGELALVDAAVAAIDAASKALWGPRCRAVLFGSQAVGLALPGSDLDVVVLLDDGEGGDGARGAPPQPAPSRAAAAAAAAAATTTTDDNDNDTDDNDDDDDDDDGGSSSSSFLVDDYDDGAGDPPRATPAGGGGGQDRDLAASLLAALVARLRSDGRVARRGAKVIRARVPVAKLELRVPLAESGGGGGGRRQQQQQKRHQNQKQQTQQKQHRTLQVDVALGAVNGASAVRFVARQVAALPPLRPLVLVAKALLKQSGLNEVFSGGLSSYALTNMALAHLQGEGFHLAAGDEGGDGAGGGQGAAAGAPPAAAAALGTEEDQARAAPAAVLSPPTYAEIVSPEEQRAFWARLSGAGGGGPAAAAGELRGEPRGARDDLGLLLLAMLRRFGAGFPLFDSDEHVVSIARGGVVARGAVWPPPPGSGGQASAASAAAAGPAGLKGARVAIEDPQQHGRDISAGSYQWPAVRAAFARAERVLTAALVAGAGVGAAAAAATATAPAAAAAAAPRNEAGQGDDGLVGGGEDAEARLWASVQADGHARTQAGGGATAAGGAVAAKRRRVQAASATPSAPLSSFVPPPRRARHHPLHGDGSPGAVLPALIDVQAAVGRCDQARAARAAAERAAREELVRARRRAQKHAAKAEAKAASAAAVAAAAVAVATPPQQQQRQQQQQQQQQRQQRKRPRVAAAGGGSSDDDDHDDPGAFAGRMRGSQWRAKHLEASAAAFERRGAKMVMMKGPKMNGGDGRKKLGAGADKAAGGGRGESSESGGRGGRGGSGGERAKRQRKNQKKRTQPAALRRGEERAARGRGARGKWVS